MGKRREFMYACISQLTHCSDRIITLLCQNGNIISLRMKNKAFIYLNHCNHKTILTMIDLDRAQGGVMTPTTPLDPPLRATVAQARNTSLSIICLVVTALTEISQKRKTIIV